MSNFKKFSRHSDDMQYATLNGIEGTGEAKFVEKGGVLVGEGCFRASNPADAKQLQLDENVFSMKFEGNVKAGSRKEHCIIDVNKKSQTYNEDGIIYFDLQGNPFR